jgi:two-component system chemotaxis response regulator CheB
MTEERGRYFLLPGDIAFASQPTLLSTLLGSCVSVCLFDETKKLGGMNHYMLPKRADTSNSGLSKGKYGDYAIKRLLAMAEKAGSRKGDLVASIFGGGHVSGHLGSVEGTGGFNVAERNIQLAKVELHRLGVKVVRQDVGDTQARKIHMVSDTNEITVKHVQRSAENVARAEKLQSLKTRKKRVLIVDDSRLVRSILRAAIESTDDMEVAGEAADPFEARELILQEAPDVICLDIIMPKMDGITFLKKLMVYKYIPTVIISTMAKAGSTLKANALKAGAVDAIDKDSLAIYKSTELLEKEVLPKLRHAATMVRS